MRLTALFVLLVLFGACAHTPENAAMSDSRIHRITSVPGLSTPPGYAYAAWAPGEDVVFFAGQVPLDSRGEVVGKGDFAAQAKQTFANLSRALAEAGVKPESVLKITYYVVGLDRDKLMALRTVRDGFFPVDAKPTSTLLGVASLFLPDVLLEVEVVAARPRT